MLPLITAYLATWLLPPRRWKPTLLKTFLGLAIAYLVLISPVGAAVAVEGLHCFLPVDDGRPVDAVVLLGRGTLLEGERSQKALEFWRSQRAPLILATGHHGEAQRLLKKLRREGVPETALINEPRARSTEENAVLSAQLLKQRDVTRILLVTDSPHMLRSLLTFRSLGFEVIPEPIPLPENLSSIQVSVTALREYVGIVGYALAGRFQPREDIAFQNLPKETQTSFAIDS